jgi:hypothetical protein
MADPQSIAAPVAINQLVRQIDGTKVGHRAAIRFLGFESSQARLLSDDTTVGSDFELLTRLTLGEFCPEIFEFVGYWTA